MFVQPTGDFLSSALSEAQIDLQPYQFMEEDDDVTKQAVPAVDDAVCEVF